MNDEAVEQIQTKIAFLESAAAELSDMVFRQHTEIQQLKAQLMTISARLGEPPAEETVRSLEQERPPHY